MSVKRELGDEARAEMLAAAQHWIDQWDDHKGGLVTSLVVIVEFATPAEGLSAPVTYAATDGNGEGLPTHRILGMIHDVDHEMQAHTLEHHRRSAE